MVKTGRHRSNHRATTWQPSCLLIESGDWLAPRHTFTEGHRTMIKVKSRGNETVDQMLRRFKKLCEKEGLIKDMKRVAYFEKPSEKRRRRLRKAQSRQLKVGMEM